MRNDSEPVTVEQLASRLKTKADKADVRRLDRRVGLRFTRLENRMDHLEKRMDRLEKRMDALAESMHDRFDRLERLIVLKFGEVGRILDEHESRIRDLEHAT